ncbi:MAG: hypothetical protein AAF694_17990 [Bacteroidota bacterium]
MNKSRIYPFLLTVFFASFLTSCDYLKDLLNGNGDPNDPIICTDEFRTIGLEIEGGELDEFYTIRKSTNDTIQVDFPVFETLYPVLDDSYQEELEGQVDEFEFVGFRESEELVRELFVIKADECHIEKVSGPDVITIQ